MPGERVIFQRVLHLRSQAIEATTHICDASDDPDFGTGRQRYHRIPPFISRISSRNSSGVRGSNSFTTPDLRCSSHRGTFPGAPSGRSSCLLRQKGFVTGLVGSGVSVSATGTGMHSCMSSSLSKPSSYWLFHLNSRLLLISCSLAIRATTAPGCNACLARRTLNSRL
ncbi:hypothetical protein SFK1770_1559 [Shigella flexneri K-1770]|nr:hypothetical protein SFVA6_2890 [Shigella flexneri VA-6]EGK25496.1 hypothetical protein SFVA6_1423 [Shigella flexneri VA-6]EIQ10674.1 hypothetical protein SFK1770_3145 [Shigella flexneri K-1770]EIQ15799.1 hypothetical protein SFK1770_1559 [Shigella flexneri K-1770]